MLPPCSPFLLLFAGAGDSLLYCCHSRRTSDMAGNPHVLSVGIDLAPALDSHGVQAQEIVGQITDACLHHHGDARIELLRSAQSLDSLRIRKR